ncbi:polysaccharide deacetylase family protein [Sedimenticola selenatireducens]|uniref:Polysaccharide deacetylase family protein n=1 Tax=Sedimenticola selenatireducens TaxID=191960 RepID=A0A558DR74_9GAMM|nr:polysaccharide deacetylase family protein [Sedimenticola selenatireducens]TVO73582.1 polysaccharide deacetylase family protein [Sedimenticola selenatireducens]TVT63522.1 MAG: polysaccharide deacetylase family protein [Sedimenticola selenatireducens]
MWKSIVIFFFRQAASYLGRNKLSILIYHRVHEVEDPMCPGEVDSNKFNWQMELVSKIFTVLPLTDAVQLLRENKLPPRSLCITFDDGYADNETVALPILQRHGLTATFFIASGYLDDGRMWNDTIIETIRSITAGKLDLTDHGFGVFRLESMEDRQNCVQSLISKLKHLPQEKRLQKTLQIASLTPKQLPTDLMMTRSQVKALSDAGMEIGGHTVSHPILLTLNPDSATKEIHNGKIQLEEITGNPVRTFAYPNGKPGVDYRMEDVDIVRKLGFECAVSTQWGVSSNTTDLYQLKRFTPWDNAPLRFLMRLMRNYFAT